MQVQTIRQAGQESSWRHPSIARRRLGDDFGAAGPAGCEQLWQEFAGIHWYQPSNLQAPDHYKQAPHTPGQCCTEKFKKLTLMCEPAPRTVLFSVN